MGLRDVAPLIEYDMRKRVVEETWGHLAPEKGVTYTGFITYAVGCYDSGDLNPTPLAVNLGKLSSSPWSYDAINEWLSDLPREYRKEGCVYRWDGSFLNYKLTGRITLITDTNK